jgi:hypothetical protein
LEAIQLVGIGNPPGPGEDELVRDVGAQVLYTTARVPGIDLRKNGEMIGWAAPCGPRGVKSDMPWKLMLAIVVGKQRCAGIPQKIQRKTEMDRPAEPIVVSSRWADAGGVVITTILPIPPPMPSVQ